MIYEGTPEWAAATSVFVLVKVKAAIGKPACPQSVKAGKKFTVSGSLKPRFPKGTKTVTVKAQRYANGKWRPYKSYKATNADSGAYSKYSVRLKITKKGKYRFYATTANTGAFAAARSAYSRAAAREVRARAAALFAALPGEYHTGAPSTTLAEHVTRPHRSSVRLQRTGAAGTAAGLALHRRRRVGGRQYAALRARARGSRCLVALAWSRSLVAVPLLLVLDAQRHYSRASPRWRASSTSRPSASSPRPTSSSSRTATPPSWWSRRGAGCCGGRRPASSRPRRWSRTSAPRSRRPRRRSTAGSAPQVLAALAAP